MAYVLDGNINLRNRDNVPGGSIVYLAEHANVSTVTLTTDGVYVSGITMSGTTKFFEYKVPRENINFTNGTEISVPNGVYIFKPLVNFNLPGLTGSTLKLFDVLVRKSVVCIIKSNDNKYYLIGKDNGLDLTSNGNFALGLGSTDLSGAVIELEGLESSRIYELNPSTASTIMSGIVSAS